MNDKQLEKLIIPLEDGGRIIVGIEKLYNDEDFDPNEEVMIAVSPGQLYHGNGIFSAFLEYAQQNKLKIHVVNSGYLQRYTVQLISGCEDLNERVIVKTNTDVTANWDKRNLAGKNKEIVAEMKAHDQLTVSYWEDWMGVKHEAGCDVAFEPKIFSPLTKAIQASYAEEKDQTFTKTIDSAVNAFYTGFHKTNGRNADYVELFETIKEEGVKKLILEYLLEEVTVIFYWQCIGKTQMAYPFLQNATGKKTIDAVRALSSKWLKDDDLKDFLPHGQMRFLNLEAKKEEPKQQKTTGRHRSKESLTTTPSPREEAVAALVYTERKNSDPMSASPPKYSEDLEQKRREAEEKIRQAQVEEEKKRLADEKIKKEQLAAKEKKRVEAEKWKLAEERRQDRARNKIAIAKDTAENITLVTGMGLSPETTLAVVEELTEKLKIVFESTETTDAEKLKTSGFFASPRSFESTPRTVKLDLPVVEDAESKILSGDTESSETSLSRSSSEGSSSAGTSPKNGNGFPVTVSSNLTLKK